MVLVAARYKPWEHLALGIFIALLCFARHYAWTWLEPELWWPAWKALSAAMVLGLLLVVWHCTRSPVMVPVCLWLAFEELQVGLCNTVYLFSPWPVPTGQTVCGAKFGFDVGAVGVLVGYWAFRKFIHAYLDKRIYERNTRS